MILCHGAELASQILKTRPQDADLHQKNRREFGSLTTVSGKADMHMIGVRTVAAVGVNPRRFGRPDLSIPYHLLQTKLRCYVHEDLEKTVADGLLSGALHIQADVERPSFRMQRRCGGTSNITWVVNSIEPRHREIRVD